MSRPAVDITQVEACATVRLENNGATFEVPRGESILDAALSKGIRLPHQCRGASCGECKAQVLDGKVDHGWALGFAITEAEKAEGYCLTCQAKPLTPALTIRTLRPPEGGDPIRELSVMVVANTPLTPRVSRLVLAPAAGDRLAHAAGDFAELVLPGVTPNRMYSFASSPRDDGLIELYVARHPHGSASGYVRDKLRTGDHVALRGPFGTCRMPEGRGPVYGLAGGTGLAPVLAIFEHSLQTGATHPHTLVLSVREDEEVFALDRLAGLAARHPQFTYEVLVTDAPSRFCARQQLAPEWVAEAKSSMDGARAVIGGSPGFVQACVQACVARGIAPEAIATDSFTPTAPQA